MKIIIIIEKINDELFKLRGFIPFDNTNVIRDIFKLISIEDKTDDKCKTVAKAIAEKLNYPNLCEEYMITTNVFAYIFSR